MRPVRSTLAVILLSASTLAAQSLRDPAPPLAALAAGPALPWSSSATGTPAPGYFGGISNPAAASQHAGPFSGFAIGVKAGLLGVGFEAATPLAQHFNLRGGANFFNYSDTFTSDGIPYDASLRFRSVETSLDWFPWARGFHISPGALLYNGNQITASANVPAGGSFTLNNAQYTSSVADPVTGNASLTFNKAAPKVSFGWGNLLPRSGRHFSLPFELGFAYAGNPKVNINLAGVACYNYQGQNYCSDVATDPTIQSNLAAQQQKVTNDVAPARFFPIFSLGAGYSF